MVLLWKGNFEDGTFTTEFNISTFQVENPKIIVTNPVRHGNYSLKEEVRTLVGGAMGRAGLQVNFNGVDKPLINVLTHPILWLRFSVYLPSELNLLSTEWVSLLSMQSEWMNNYGAGVGGVGRSFGANINFERRQLYFIYPTGSGDGQHTIISSGLSHYNTYLASMTKGVWHDFIIGQKFVGDNTGWTEIYHKLSTQTNWILIVDKSGYRTDYTPETATSIESTIYIQSSFYRGTSAEQASQLPTQWFYKDDHRLGTTRADVEDLTSTPTPTPTPLSQVPVCGYYVTQEIK